MVDQCPHCHQELNLSAAQIDTIRKALAGLPPGQLLKMSCPLCKNVMEMVADGSLVGPGRSKDNSLHQKKLQVEPPREPNLDWLASGKYQHQEVIKDVPMVLVLMAEGPAKSAVLAAFAELDYEQVVVESAEEAIERMRFTNFGAVVLHSRYEGGDLHNSLFHTHMRNLNMARRRPIFYILIGPEFHTLYNLEALTHSANLVVNDHEAGKIGLILKKAIPEYEALFAPYVDTLLAHGYKEGTVWAEVRRKTAARRKSDVLKELLDIT